MLVADDFHLDAGETNIDLRSWFCLYFVRYVAFHLRWR